MNKITEKSSQILEAITALKKKETISTPISPKVGPKVNERVTTKMLSEKTTPPQN